MGIEEAAMSSGTKKSFAQFPPDFRLPAPEKQGPDKQETGKQAGKKATAPATVVASNSTYYRQGVLVPGGPPARPASRSRLR